MSGSHTKEERRHIRHLRIRNRVSGTEARPRLAVFRSAKHIYAQLIDDTKGATLVFASSREAMGARVEGKGKVAVGQAVGRLIAERAREKGVTRVCFDRGGNLYHGRIKALAEGARAAGLEF